MLLPHPKLSIRTDPPTTVPRIAEHVCAAARALNTSLFSICRHTSTGVSGWHDRPQTVSQASLPRSTSKATREALAFIETARNRRGQLSRPIIAGVSTPTRPNRLLAMAAFHGANATHDAHAFTETSINYGAATIVILSPGPIEVPTVELACIEHGYVTTVLHIPKSTLYDPMAKGPIRLPAPQPQPAVAYPSPPGQPHRDIRQYAADLNTILPTRITLFAARNQLKASERLILDLC